VQRMASLTDGTSNTIFLAEKLAVCLNDSVPSGYSGAKASGVGKTTQRAAGLGQGS
jgi:hypothetical protein